METSPYSWEVALFIWLFYAVVALLLAALGIVHSLTKRQELTEGKSNLHANTLAEQLNIRATARFSTLPYGATIVVWTSWLVTLLVDHQSIFTLVMSFLAFLAVVGCIWLFISLQVRVYKYGKSRSRPMRH
jgi:hypothetical protein